MKFLIVSALGLITGIFMYLFWKKIFGKYLPQEDAFLLKLICAGAYYITGIINGIFFILKNIYVLGIGIFLFIIVFAASYCFGIYYKIIAKKILTFDFYYEYPCFLADRLKILLLFYEKDRFSLCNL